MKRIWSNGCYSQFSDWCWRFIAMRIWSAQRFTQQSSTIHLHLHLQSREIKPQFLKQSYAINFSILLQQNSCTRTCRKCTKEQTSFKRLTLLLWIHDDNEVDDKSFILIQRWNIVANCDVTAAPGDLLFYFFEFESINSFLQFKKKIA